ncbi:hypothetical protein J3R83DRAFT_539 [Lanmaoa asiatica]|nr:hypothetical protein J3R83DRAFT_539 [Lanmaoa asiatica]
MSRHRLIRNIDIHAELDDAAFDDDADDLTEEQHGVSSPRLPSSPHSSPYAAQMESGIEHIRAIVGDEASSGLDDAIIRDTLWQSYFDIEQSIAWLFAPQDPTGPAGYVPEDLERPRVPLIVLAQQGQFQTDYYPTPQYLDYDQEVDPDDVPLGLMSPDRHSRLSTITELTERTEPSRHWPSRQQLVAMNNPRALSSSETTSSYGNVIGESRCKPFSAAALIIFTEHSPDPHPNVGYPYQPVDPNRIPPSPSPSAVQRLSSYDSAPSLRTPAESEVQSEPPKSPPRVPSISMPATDNIPEIPDFTSKSSEKPPPPPAKDLPQRVRSAKRSKLAELASSRASTISSSRSSDLETTSVLTYPALRPSAESRLSLASRATTVKPLPSEVSEQSLPSVKIPRTPEKPTSTASVKSSPSVKPPSTTISSMSSHVRKAIQTAMDLEAHDQQATAGKQADNVSDISVSTVKPERHVHLPRSSIPTEPVLARSKPGAKARPQSKLAKLAQAKADSHALVPRVPVSPPKELPKSHTEYLTPIANGATATTAITTSYQSLQSLSSSQALKPVPLVQMPGTETRSSKLALKVKKAQAKSPSHSSATDDEGSLPSPPPLFLPSPTRSRALPSAFASLLLNDPLTSSEDKDKDNKSPKYGREELNLVDMYHASLSRSNSTLGYELEQHERSRVKPPTSPDLSVRSTSFTFDVPSPDDIVFNARRGTTLAQRQ